MDTIGIVALIVSGASLALAVLCLVRGRDRWIKAAIQLASHENRLDTHSECMVRKFDFNDLRKVMDAHIRKDASEAKMIGLVLAERIDAISARLDAVELACGLREKPKTMGGHGA